MKKIRVTLQNGKIRNFTADEEMITKKAFFLTGPRGGVSSMVKADDGSGWYLVSDNGSTLCTWEVVA